jgi:hypothetical protein
MSGAEFLDDEVLQAPREDRNEGNRNERDEVLLRAREDGIQPPIAAQPGKGPFDHPTDAGGDKLSTAAVTSDPAHREQALSRVPAGRWGRPEDGAGLAIFLASRASDYVTGAIIPCDGGFLAY